MYRKVFKPILDFFAALTGLLILSPIFILVTLSLAIVNDGKPFFFQKRPGKNERIFKIIKFKTMNDKRDVHGQLLPDADRLTTVGRFVRSSSLDELPQLLNVLIGDMSFVGPRPLLPQYLPLYNQLQSQRHKVKPGITGWAQVNGRNTVSWEQKFKYDVWYVNNQSFMQDIRILIMTVVKVLKKEGVNQDGQATAEIFKGN
ncbi:sugar transferase [Aequorivita capsosiphonis]|uniref:sugar transferase n=1 Tax=Aequorivita capsosiphonis TaxID=487317 RepID=UPI0004080DE8|nr:sugar transferase [Aequorivita capsosiphonis]